MPRYNDTTNQQRIAAAAAAIVDYDAYHALPDSAKAAQRLVWQALLRAGTGCTERTARKYVNTLVAKRGRRESEVIEGKKYCPKCNTWKKVEDFYNEPRAKTGLTSHCVECIKKRARRRRERQGIPKRKRGVIVDGKLQCNKCEKWKPLDDFYERKGNSTGRRPTCKQCVSEQNMDKRRVATP